MVIYKIETSKIDFIYLKVKQINNLLFINFEINGENIKVSEILNNIYYILNKEFNGFDKISFFEKDKRLTNLFVVFLNNLGCKVKSIKKGNIITFNL